MNNYDNNFSKPPQQQINSLLKLYQTGKYVDAEKLSLSLTEEFPKHPFAWKVLAAVLKQMDKINESLIACQKAIKLEPQDTEVHNNLGATLQELGRFEEAEQSLKQAIKLKPDFAKAHNNLGNTLKELGRLEEAETSYKKGIKLKPDYAEAHSNLGVTLQELGRFEEAKQSLKQAIKLKPDFFKAHNNLGLTLQELGRFEEAETSFRKGIKLKPDYAEAHNNLGGMLQKLGKLKEAMNCYIKAIKLNSELLVSSHNLVELLTSYTDHKKISHPIVKVHQEIKKIYLKEVTSGIISDDKIIQLFHKSKSIIKKFDLKIATNLSQVYRRNSTNLNCKRHMDIFNKFNIIPKFCFGCYIVQIEPRSLLELIKLLVVFDQIKLVKNNTRKCMIEMRTEVSGFYKGLIYCSSTEEAYQIANYLEIVLEKNISPGLHAVVKRGCSEYPISFPAYKAINKSGSQLMNYNEDWKSIEQDYDSLNSIKSSKIITPSLFGLSLQDVLIIQNWIDYAKGIGDQSVHLLDQNKIFTSETYKDAKSRIEKYQWKEIS